MLTLVCYFLFKLGDLLFLFLPLHFLLHCDIFVVTVPCPSTKDRPNLVHHLIPSGLGVENIFKYDHPNLLQIYLEAFAMFNHGIPRTNVEGLPRRGFEGYQIDIFTSFQKFCNYLT